MLFSTALSTLSGYLGAYLANRLTLEFARRIYTHVLSLSLPVLRTWQIGELFTRIGEVDMLLKVNIFKEKIHNIKNNN
ncbi:MULTISPECIES: hypothetical protein [unclassified Bartonella]|uniref:hypothetical protein n=1 Tax=unclassified Bartonella TaxID=2645622 RepID=UPI0035CF8627